MEDKTLQKRLKEWREKGKSEREITYGMLCDGFQSTHGIPDSFYSAEDPADRAKLYHEHKMENDKTYAQEHYRRMGRCWRCGRDVNPAEGEIGCWCD